MGTLPALVGFQVPNMNLGETYTQMARLAAYDQARRASALEVEEKRAQRDRDAQVRQLLAASLQPQPQGPGQGFTSAQPQAGPPAAAPPQEPTMPPLGVPVPVNTQPGVWGQTGGFTAAQPPAIAAMAPPVDTSQPPLQGGGFTQAPVGTPAQTTVGAAAAQPAAPAPQPVSLTTAQPGAPTPQTGFAAPQPTRPLSASVPGVLPLPDPEKIQQAMLLNPQMTSQWYGAHLTQRGKQLEEVKRNNQLVYQYGKAIQANPAFYQQALKELEELGVPVPKNMPPTYNAALIQFHIDKSRDIDTAVKEQQLENQKAQAQLHQAQAQDVPRRTELESTRLGLQGTTATMNDELRAMGVNPAAATTEQRQQAQKNIQARELEKEREKELQRGKTEAELRGEKTVSEVFGPKATQLFDTQTMDTVPSRMKVKDYEAMPAGRVKELSPRLTEHMENIRTSVPVIVQLQEHIDKIYGPGGVLARMTPDERADLAAAPGRWAKQYAQKYPELIAAQRFIDGNKSTLARALAGEKGAMSEGDVERAKALLPNLETSLQLWPPNKLAIQAPDTRAVALATMNNIVDMVNSRLRTLLGNEQLTHPKLHRYETAEETQRGAGGPVSPPPVAPPDTRPSTFGPGDPTQQLRPPPPPPAAPPSAPVTPAPAFGPSFGAPAQRAVPAPPPPGRQSQAPPAGAPRVASWWGQPPQVMSERDVQEAMRQTGRSREEVMQAARARRYTLTA